MTIYTPEPIAKTGKATCWEQAASCCGATSMSTHTSAEATENISNYSSMKWTDVPTQVEKIEDGKYMLLATIEKCTYGKDFEVRAYDGNDEAKHYNRRSFLYSRNDFLPYLDDSHCDWDSDGNIVASMTYRMMNSDIPVLPGEFSVDINGTKFTPQVEDFGNRQKVTVVINPRKDLPEGTYSEISFGAKNITGGRTYYINNLSLTVSESTATYTDDGEKSDCIRLCGIDWAKGNLVDNKIATHNWETEYCYGNNPTEAKGEEVKGDDQLDIVAQNLPGWVTPSAEDFRKLMEMSYIYCKISDGTYGLLFQTCKPGEKRFVANLPNDSPLNETTANKLGLFLPDTNGYYRYRYTESSNYSYYRTSSGYHYESGANVEYSTVFRFRNTTEMELKNFSYYYSYSYGYTYYYFRFNIRPIKK